MSATGRFATWAGEVMSAGLSPEVRAAAAAHVKDTVGVIVAGSPSEPVTSIRQFLSPDGPAASDSLPSIPDQALVLGTAAHALDFDNSHFPSLVHPSGVIVPAALVVGSAAGRTSEQLLTAIAVGEELALRLGVAACNCEIGNSELFERGFHPTSVCCAIGAAATASALLQSTPAVMAHGIGIAGSFASGLLEGNRTGGSVKPVQSGWAAASGIRAALMAASGVTAPPTALEGRFGFGHAFAGRELDADVLLAGLGQRWEASRVGVKAFPANGFTHTSIETALDLRERGLQCDEVAEVKLGVAAPTVRTIGEPRSEKISPPNGYTARFSGPFTFVLALYGGSGLGVGLRDFSDAMLSNETVRALAGRTYVVADGEQTAQFPERTGCTTTVKLRSGLTMASRADIPRGSIGWPLTSGQIDTKFRDCAAIRLSSPQIEQLEQNLAVVLADRDRGRAMMDFTRGLVSLVMSADGTEPR